MHIATIKNTVVMNILTSIFITDLLTMYIESIIVAAAKRERSEKYCAQTDIGLARCNSPTTSRLVSAML
jgi:hypothetical protein